MAAITCDNNLGSLISTGNDAFSNLFLAVFSLGKPTDTEDIKLTESFSVRCEGFEPPVLKYGTHQVHFLNEFIDLPSPIVDMDRTFNLTFRVDSNYSVYTTLVKLRNKIFDLSSSTTTGLIEINDGDSGVFSVDIYAVISNTIFGEGVGTTQGVNIPNISSSLTDTSSNKILFKYKKCWIESISPLTFNSESSEPEKVQVKVNFSEFEDCQTQYNAEGKLLTVSSTTP